MQELVLEPGAAQQLARLYADMENAYEQVAASLCFSCDGCPDNCCDSYFKHHTYIEWAYLWAGLATLPTAKVDLIRQRAADYILQSEKILARAQRPTIMCPLNEAGRCFLYSHRLMICRLHGVPAGLTLPDGRRLTFPGCFRCQEQTDPTTRVAQLDRTIFYRRLVALEVELLGARRHYLPKVNKTMAQMLVEGAPRA